MLDSFWLIFDRLLVILGFVGLFSIIGGLLLIGIVLLRGIDSPSQLPPKEDNQH